MILVGRKLPPGIKGAACFEDNNHRRLWLSRWWGGLDVFPTSGFWLWIGMNPSVASGTIDDQTCAKEVRITIREGGSGYLKCNVMDWIETNSRLMTGVSNPCSPTNRITIKNNASKANTIICAWGSLPPKLQHYANDVLSDLAKDHYPLFCLGTNVDGSPKHPLYLPNDSVVQHYRLQSRMCR